MCFFSGGPCGIHKKHPQTAAYYQAVFWPESSSCMAMRLLGPVVRRKASRGHQGHPARDSPGTYMRRVNKNQSTWFLCPHRTSQHPWWVFPSNIPQYFPYLTSGRAAGEELLGWEGKRPTPSPQLLSRKQSYNCCRMSFRGTSAALAMLLCTSASIPLDSPACLGCHCEHNCHVGAIQLPWLPVLSLQGSWLPSKSATVSYFPTKGFLSPSCPDRLSADTWGEVSINTSHPLVNTASLSALHLKKAGQPRFLTAGKRHDSCLRATSN